MLRVIQMPDSIIESDLKQLFMWTKNSSKYILDLQELCKSQQVLIEVQDERLSNIEQSCLPIFERLSNIEHDLALVLSVIKDRKNST